MKVEPLIALLSASIAATASAATVRGVDHAAAPAPRDPAADSSAPRDDDAARQLQGNGCFGGSTPPAAAWHPNYPAGWTNGHCIFTVDCNSPSFDTELECCQGSYAGQVSGACVASLPNPPTTSPTETGALDVFYPDYTRAWTEGVCINARPMPSGRPTYGTMLECCQGAYRGQTSGTCLSALPSPPTMSPTETGGLDVYYPDYDATWSEGTCINIRPLPSGRATYATQLECCQGAYRGQASGACLGALPSPPTMSPTQTGGLDVYYPDYDADWSVATCINTRPLPSGRPTYATILECCQGAYGGQTSGACLASLPSPPTMSPTETGGLDVYYPDYDADWSVATCINTRPLPSGRPTFATLLECCQGAYGGQTSGACLASLPSPPTMSPTETGELDVFYPDYDTDWSQAGCVNTRPLPSGRPTYPTLLDCCKGAYGGQASGACLAQLPSPPTSSPTETGGLDVFYPDYTLPFSEGVCVNDRPLPSGRPTYANPSACCAAAYAGQGSLACMCDAVGVCFSCACGTEAERTAAGGCPGLTCS